MNNTVELLNPEREVKLRERTVIVRELSWHKQRDFTLRLSQQLNAIVGAVTGAGGSPATLNVATLGACIKDSTELSEWLVSESTGLNMDEIGKLGTSEFFALMDHALDLNFTSYMSGAKKAFGRIGKFVGKNAAQKTTQPTALEQQ